MLVLRDMEQLTTKERADSIRKCSVLPLDKTRSPANLILSNPGGWLRASGNSEEGALSRLREAGLRVTRPRLLVYGVLREVGGHRSVDDLVHLLNERGHQVPRMSVYNVGGLRRALPEGPQALSRTPGEHPRNGRRGAGDLPRDLRELRGVFEGKLNRSAGRDPESNRKGRPAGALFSAS
ncbi:MAG: transcriptional repressor [Planctomycetota bacterium]